MREVERVWDVEGEKLPIHYRLDFSLTRDKMRIVAHAEIKQRWWRFGSGNGFRISMAKVDAAEALIHLRQRCLLVVRFSDMIIRWFDFREPPVDTIWAGRWIDERGGYSDMEPMAVYPWDYGWHLLETKPERH